MGEREIRKASKTVIFSQTNLVYHIFLELTRGNVFFLGRIVRILLDFCRIII